MNLKEEMEFLASGRSSKVDFLNEIVETDKAKQVKRMVATAASQGKILVYFDRTKKAFYKVTANLSFFDEKGNRVPVNVENTATNGLRNVSSKGESDYSLEDPENFK